MNRVYICSRYAGDIDLNVKNARALCRLALDEGASPMAPHLLYPQVLDDGDPDQRLVGRMAALSWVAACDEVWVYADDRGPSEGMIAEIAYAEALEKPVRRLDREMKDITGSHSGNLQRQG